MASGPGASRNQIAAIELRLKTASTHGRLDLRERGRDANGMAVGVNDVAFSRAPRLVGGGPAYGDALTNGERVGRIDV